MAVTTSRSNRSPFPFRWVVTALVIWFSGLTVLGWHFSNPTSPDEAANRLMAETWATSHSLQWQTPIPSEALAKFHPRSFTPAESALRPGSFIGFIMIVGWVRQLGSLAPVIFIALAGLISSLAWIQIARRYWETPWVLASLGLMLSLPVLLAHQVLPYTQPALYVACLLVTGLALLRYQEHQTYRRAIVVGLLYGLALCVRPIELIFTGPIIVVVMLAHRNWKHLLLTIGATLMVQIPWMLVARETFGSILASGYSASGIDIVATGKGLPVWQALFVPPGGHWSWHFLTSFQDYLLLLYPVVSSLAVAGLLMYFRRKFVDPIKILKIGLVGVFVVYYLAYYGSWDLYPDVAATRIGSAGSYARYWLPLYIGLSAGAVVFLRTIFAARIRVGITLIGAIVLLQLGTWYFHPSGFQKTVHDDRIARELRARVLSHTEPSSFIFTGQDDKLFVDQRFVSFTYPQTQEDWTMIQKIAVTRSVYFLNHDAGFSAQQAETFTQEIHARLIPIAVTSSAQLWKLAPL